MIRYRTVFKSGVIALCSAAFLVASSIAAGDRDGWQHYKDEGSKHEVFGDFAGAQRAYARSLSLANPPAATAAERGEVMARLANSMIWQQKFEGAEPYFEELLKIIPGLKAEGKRSEDFFSCVEALSNAYFERVSGPRRVSGIQHSIRLIDTAFGEGHPALLKELVALAHTCSALGMNQEALSFANRALALAKKDKSEKGQIQYWKALVLVGSCRKSAGDWEGARKIIQDAVSLMEGSRKKFSLTAASAKAQLAIIAYHLHRTEESKKYFREAESLYLSKIAALDAKNLKQIGTSGPELLAFAEMYISHNQYDKAEPICKRAIIWTQVAFGPKDVNLIKEYQVHGFILSRLGRLKESAKEEAAALELARQYRGAAKE